MDLTILTNTFTPDFFVNLLSIIIIDLVLAGDNSIVIAMAVQGLHPKKRFKGILFGALAAVLLRVIFTLFASKMLAIPFVKLGGGILIFWIAFKLMNDSGDGEHKKNDADSLWKAIWIILVADLTMSLDNILAVAAASHGSLHLLIIGLGLSIPMVVFASTLVSKLMEKFKIIIWIGAAILGKVGAEMIITDPVFVKHILSPANLIEIKNGLIHANHFLSLAAECFGAIVVIAVASIQRMLAKSEVATFATNDKS
jgi:YjbE family integral membrane protein